MREIKYQAWERDAKRMFNVAKLEWQKDGLWAVTPMNQNNEATGMLVGTACDLREFTGLKDKNGKEIYEGDIVKTIRDGTPQTYPELVEFGEYGWLPWEFEAGDSYYSLGEVEVIGNIWENPKLLEVKSG